MGTGGEVGAEVGAATEDVATVQIVCAVSGKRGGVPGDATLPTLLLPLPPSRTMPVCIARASSPRLMAPS